MSVVGRWLLALALLPVAAGLCFVIMQLPESGATLHAPVMKRLAETGVENPVTAVLLNYRGYDTLLEMVVLLLALLGAWGLSDGARQATLPGAGHVLERLTGLLAPVLIVVAAYLLWVGAYSPGGAFQAGAVLAGAGVLMNLVDPGWQGWRWQRAVDLMLLPGVAAFVVVGLFAMLRGGAFLEYPADKAGGLILLIESCAMLSIAVTLHTLFAGTARVGADR